MSLKRPYSEQAERAVLGAAITDPSVVGYVVSSLNEEDFYVESLRYIFRAISILKEDRVNVDFTSVVNKLNDLHLLDAVGGVEEITSLVDGVVNTNIEFYVEDLKDKTNLRRLANFIEKSYDEYEEKSSLKIHEYMHDFESDVLTITRNRTIKDFKNINELAAKYNEKMNSAERPKNIKSGYSQLDYYLNGGFGYGDLIILAARPAMGKTALALNMAYNVCKINHTPVLFFSLEMQGNQLLNRLISSLGNLDSNQVQNMKFDTKQDTVKLELAFNKLKDMPLYIDDTPGLKLADFRAKARKMKTQFPNLGLIVIDYLQLIKCEATSREQEVAKVARELKEIARELDVPVLSLAQVNRRADMSTGKGESKVSKRPELSDLRESGQIEQDADVISFIYREAYYENEIDPNQNQDVELIIRKNRNGLVGTVHLVFSPRYAKFTARLGDAQEAQAEKQ